MSCRTQGITCVRTPTYVHQSQKGLRDPQGAGGFREHHRVSGSLRRPKNGFGWARKALEALKTSFPPGPKRMDGRIGRCL